MINIISVFNGTEKTQQSNDKTVNNSTNSKTNNKDSNNTNGTSNANNQNASKDSKKNTVQYLKCEVKFEGKYEDLDKFLNSIGQNEKKIVINSIKLSSDTSKGIKGTIDLEFYSVPKIDDELESYLKWDINKTYGKNVPFGAGTSHDTSAASTASDKAVSGAQKNTEQGDFIASVKPIASDLPTIMMGKAKDDLRTSYVYADSNSMEQVEMILSQDGDKYYYKYKTSKGTFPANYDGLGKSLYQHLKI